MSDQSFDDADVSMVHWFVHHFLGLIEVHYDSYNIREEDVNLHYSLPKLLVPAHAF